MFRPCVLLLFICSLGHADSVICCGTERVFIVDESGREQWSCKASDPPQPPRAADKPVAVTLEVDASSLP